MAVGEAANTADRVPRLFGAAKSGVGDKSIGTKATTDAYILVGVAWVSLILLVWTTGKR